MPFLLIRRRRVGILVMTVLALGAVLAGVWVGTETEYGREEIVVRFFFLLPMHQGDAERKLQVIPETPRVMPEVSTAWAGKSVLIVRIREPEELQGQQIRLKLTGAKTLWLPVSKSVTVVVQRPVRPRLLDLTPTVPTRGPLLARFNTPLDRDSVTDNLVLLDRKKPVPGRWEPAGGDHSVWLFEPLNPLTHDRTYTMLVKKGLRSESGPALEAEVKKSVRTASALELLSSKPQPGAEQVDLHPEILLEYNLPLNRARVEMPGVRGRTEVWANRVQFTPLEVLLPGQEYRVRVEASSVHGERLESEFAFATLEMKNRMWVAVDLEGTHNVTVYRDREPIRTFRASGGKVSTPTPLGTYYVYNRGYSFYNARLNEGAYYWVQFSGPFLFHSIPFDASGKIIEEEAEKLGRPASHGCVRLSLEDARWFYENVPNGTMIVIYNNH